MADGSIVDVAADALFADDGTTPFAPSTPGVAESALNPATGRVFTQAEVDKIREDEKNKVYGRLEEVQNELTQTREQIGTLSAEAEARKKALEAEEQRLEAERKRQEEEGLSAKELVRRSREEWEQQFSAKEQEWNTRWSEAENARLAAEAAAAKEREFTNLRDYVQQQITVHKDDIAPQLVPYIVGNTQEEVNASIQQAINTTNEIAAEMQQAMGLGQIPPNQQAFVYDQQNPQQVQVPGPGTRPFAPGAQVDPAGAQQQTYTAEQIAAMPMDKYAQFRQQAGIGGQSNARGLLG